MVVAGARAVVPWSPTVGVAVRRAGVPGGTPAVIGISAVTGRLRLPRPSGGLARSLEIPSGERVAVTGKVTGPSD